MSITFATQYPLPPSSARSRSGPRTLGPSIYQVRGEEPQFGLDWATCRIQICWGKSGGLWSGPARSCVQWPLRTRSGQSNAWPRLLSGMDMRPSYQEHGWLTVSSCPLLQAVPWLPSLIAHVPFLGWPRPTSEQGCGPNAEHFCLAPDSSPWWAVPQKTSREPTPLPTQPGNAPLPSHRSHWAACLTLALGLEDQCNRWPDSGEAGILGILGLLAPI